MILQFKKEYEGNSRQTEVIDRLSKLYTGNDVIEWYTSYSYFHSTVNKALRLLHVDSIFMLGRYIVDFYRQLSLLQSMLSMSPDSFIAYRGTALPKKDLKNIKDNNESLISLTSFISTSRLNKVAACFHGSDIQLRLKFTLFEIKIEQNDVGVPFGDVSKLSKIKDEEEEVLFSCNLILSIDTVVLNNGQWYAKLYVSDEQNKDIDRFITFI